MCVSNINIINDSNDIIININIIIINVMKY